MDRMAPELRVQDVAVRLGRDLIFDAVSFAVEARTTLAVIGVSGSGKTTLLRAIAGLAPIARGSIHLGGRRVDALAPNCRNIVYLNQEPLLFPHLDLFENMAFGLRLRKVAEADVRSRVDALLGSLELDGLAGRFPHALSGGQRQRAAFGRALAVEPAMLLLDEPFSNLDPQTRASMQLLFKRVSRERGISAIFVTHDLKESLQVGDRFAVLCDGRLRSFGDRAAFCRDPSSGVAREARYWSEVATPAAGGSVRSGSEQAAGVVEPLANGEDDHDDE